MRAEDPSSLQCEPEHGCITCGDEAVPLSVLKLDDVRGLALCENDEGARETVEIALIPEVSLGDRLLVHAGTAIARLENEEVA
ncbi:MAG: HypC/HybG/HupF family hydrogenase formation chaperone [Actinomycetota bacterium]|nr:HypC/HybG/HupF family hydrogenase formation chaperone [Actinomycetota bacterium]